MFFLSGFVIQSPTCKEAGVSSGIVTGPSFCICTCMYAPNFPSKPEMNIVKLNASIPLKTQG